MKGKPVRIGVERQAKDDVATRTSSGKNGEVFKPGNIYQTLQTKAEHLLLSLNDRKTSTCRCAATVQHTETLTPTGQELNTLINLHLTYGIRIPS